ncbi:RDD family protein [Neobacillus fumarioli]|uniref:RDD family protein n=1 Tax=Neobacillus fumarioli TaxID=105229 RepID=UPI00082E1AD0|nr:RDD family protein [Neobacillus fumarioli]
MNQEELELKTPEYVSLNFQTAGVGSRAAAYLIDQLILYIMDIMIIMVTVFTNLGMFKLSNINDHGLAIAIMIIVLFIINGGYFFALEFFFGGRTIGKKLLGIRVIQENGHSVTLLSSFIRNLLRIIDALPICYLLGIFLIFFHPRHKRLCDLAAGTIVVHERKAKRKKKLSPIDKEIQLRGISKSDLTVGEWELRSFQEKDWQLIKTYAGRLLSLSSTERSQLTKQIAGILLPKIGFDPAGKTELELENTLLALYVILKEEWEFEI